MATDRTIRKPMFSKWYYERSGKVEMLPPSEVMGWFNDVLGKDDPKPTHEQCEVLSQEFRKIINRQDNSEAKLANGGQSVPLDLLRDVSPLEEERRIVEEFRLACNAVLVKAEELRERFGGYRWENSCSPPVTLVEIEDILGRTGAFPTKASPPTTRRGQPPKAWKGPGRKIARLISDALKKAGYPRSVAFDDDKGAVACIGAKAIRWAYGTKLRPSGFASAMRPQRHSRSKGNQPPGDFSVRFPEVARIKPDTTRAVMRGGSRALIDE